MTKQPDKITALYCRLSRDEDDEDMSPYEPTYRDGSAKNECWRDDDG